MTILSSKYVHDMDCKKSMTVSASNKRLVEYIDETQCCLFVLFERQ